MRILLLVQKEQRVILDRLYDSIALHSGDCDTRWLSDAEQADLAKFFADHIDTARYDRIIFMLRFKKEIRQRRFIRTVPNLVILEHDAWQNYAPGKYLGEYSRHYRALPWARIICSGHEVTRRLLAEGFDAHFVAKGYDQALLRNLHQPRDTELAFVGSTRNRLYQYRQSFLEQLAALEGLEVVRTKSGEDYLNKLNAIRFFVSVDIGMGEYMIKNFEAMACGCVLFAYDQGESENSALGFRDMVNLVLYRDLAELRGKLQRLRSDDALCASIAAAGQQLAQDRFSFDVLGAQIVETLRPPLRDPTAHPAATRLSEWRRRLRATLRR